MLAWYRVVSSTESCLCKNLCKVHIWLVIDLGQPVLALLRIRPMSWYNPQVMTLTLSTYYVQTMRHPYINRCTAPWLHLNIFCNFSDSSIAGSYITLALGKIVSMVLLWVPVVWTGTASSLLNVYTLPNQAVGTHHCRNDDCGVYLYAGFSLQPVTRH